MESRAGSIPGQGFARRRPGKARRDAGGGSAGRGLAAVAGRGGDVAGGGQQGQERADPVSFLGGVPERAVRVDGVPGAPAGPGAGNVPGGLQVGHDGLDGALGDAGPGAEVPDPGLRAISTRTCPCPVSSVQLPLLSSGTLISRDHNLAREFSRVKTRDIFLVILLTHHAVRDDPGSAMTGPPACRQGSGAPGRRRQCRDRSRR